MKNFFFISILLFTAAAAQAQTAAESLRAGNRFYKQRQYQQALPEFQNAVAQDPSSPVARYNLANAQFRSQQFAEAEKEYDAAVESSQDAAFKQMATYNKGVALTKQKKLLESIEAYKQALKMDPTDADARFNLQKALSELKKQTEGEQKKQEQKQQQQKQQQQKPQQNPTNKRQIEQWLNSLRQKEQEVQRKIQEHKSRSVSRPEKDW